MLHRRGVLAIVLGLLGFSPFILLADAPVAVAPKMPVLTEGALPNGLHYLVLPHTAPRGGISLQLIVEAGSLDEHDDERGFAHFVEHMAFNGTTHHPPGTLTELFQRFGLTFGADLNAHTTYLATVYKLDLPEGRGEHFAEALQLLRDYADGLAFVPAEVEREKKVVVSELQARDTSAARTGEEINRHLFASTLIAERMVGGIPDQILHASPAALRAFYRRCYQPGRMTVVITGAVDAARLVEQVTTEFGSLSASAGAPAPVEAEAPTLSTSPVAHVAVNPSGSGFTVSLMAVVERPADTAEGWRREFVETIAGSVLQRRVQERREKDVKRFGPSSAGSLLVAGGRFVLHSLDVQAGTTRWTESVDFAESELRRAQLEGFDDAEIKEVVASSLTGLRNRVHALPSLSTQQLAGELSNSVISRHHWRTPAETLAFAERELPTITAAEATAALDTMFPEENLHLLIRVSKPLENGEALALAAYQKSAQTKLPGVHAASAELHFRYGDFGPPGKIVAEKTEADLGLRLATFANGVQLNLRPSNLEPERFRLQAVVGRGLLDVPRNRSGLPQLATYMLNANDLGRHTRSELSRLARLHGVGGGFVLVDNTCTANFSGPSEELPFVLQLLTAMLSDQKLDPARQSVAQAFYSSMVHSAVATPGSTAQYVARYRLSGGDPRCFITPTATVAKYRFSEVDDWIHRCWLEGPLEIGIVGDFKPEDVLASAAASIGTLGARTPPSKKNAEPLRFTTTSGKQVTRPKLKAGAAASFLAWPATLPDDPRNNRALQLAADVLMDRLRVKFREDLGATYSPHASVFRERQQRDYGYVWAGLTFEPGRASALTDGVIALADELAKNGATAEEIERLREPRRTANALQLRDNGWWLGAVVSCAQSRPDALEEARGHLVGYDSITREDVNRAASALQEDAVTAVVVIPALSEELAPATAAR